MSKGMRESGGGEGSHALSGPLLELLQLPPEARVGLSQWLAAVESGLDDTQSTKSTTTILGEEDANDIKHNCAKNPCYIILGKNP